MTSTIVLPEVPIVLPQLDRAAIEQARLVRPARDRLVSTELSVDYGGLARGRDSTVLAARQWVKRQRSRKRLFVVDHGGTTLIPSFHLDEVFDADDRAGGVVARLTVAGLSGWAQWQWFTSLNPWIDARPIDVIGTDAVERAIDGLAGA